MILIFNRLKKTHLEILSVNTMECNEKSKTGQVSHVCELHDSGYRGTEQHCCHSYFSHTHIGPKANNKKSREFRLISLHLS